MSPSSPDILGLLEEALAEEVCQKQAPGSPDKSKYKVQAADEEEGSLSVADYHQNMTQITQDKIEKGGLKHEETEKAPLVQEVTEAVKKRLISKQVEDRTAEKCEIIGKRWEEERGKLIEKLELHKGEAMHCEDAIGQGSLASAELGDLIEQSEDSIKDLSSKLAEKNDLIKERKDDIEELDDDLHDKHDLTMRLEAAIDGIRHELSDLHDERKKCQDSVEEVSSDNLAELDYRIEEGEDLIEEYQDDIEGYEDEIRDVVDLMVEHEACVKELSSESAKLDSQIKVYEVKLSQYRYEKWMRDEHKKRLQEAKGFFEQLQKKAGDMITNRELEVGEEIREAYRLAKEEVERSAN
ncbi:unnamed protein product [Clonostachys solani]|uniref:Uncharacterized protein n=1 Tax=Clonostachys solani TaxID=160281 RepID=A0A9N9ZH81_9HYPO|nr:unnamed protein product [Clonostachys solani]